MSSIPNGIYHPKSSIIHRLGAFTKMLCLLILLVAIIFTGKIFGYAVLFACLLALGIVSRLPIRLVINSVRRMFWFFTVILLMNTCFYGTENVWFKWWIFTPSAEGLIQGLNVILRVIFLLILSNIITMTTAPIEINRALEQMLYPLKFIGIPTSQVAMILSVAVQFISTLSEEAEAIRLAQTSRGAKFDSRRIGEKAGAVIPLLVPIFLASFKRADELSLAMEARGYQVNKKRKVKPPSFKTADYISVALCILLCVLSILIFH